MLLELSITDFAIIERTTIRFTEGLNALTGETGAGKSILIDALGAVLGSRIGSDLVRTGARLARIEAAFTLDPVSHLPVQDLLAELGIDPIEEESLILSREIQANGRSSARINGRLASAGTLSQIGLLLVDIHGQSDHLAILKSSEQRSLLDRFASLDEIRNELAGNVRDWRAVRDQIQSLTTNSREREQRVDLLRFQVDEIDAASLNPGEDDELIRERDVLRNADRLRADALEALTVLTDDDMTDGSTATVLLRTVAARTADIAELDAGATSLSEQANELLVLAEDLGRELRTYSEGVDPDERRLAEIDERIDTIQTLKRKYGSTIADILDFAERARAELESLSSRENDVTALEEREAELRDTLVAQASTLSSRRTAVATELSTAIEASVADLGMGRSLLRIDIRQREDATGIPFNTSAGGRTVHLDETGIDEVEYLIAPNAGESLKPLTRIASGGETARLMLATKSILSDVDRTPTLVFDEIDVGVGGRSGQVVGEKLWGIARKHQVIVVSHLPQVAAFADTHLRIEKYDSSGRTLSEVRTLDDEERELELAAMLDGTPVTDAARQNARSMLDRSRNYITAATGR
ncbi:MAG: DNA repair protein RecN [Chloroflexia bacterium]|nr:DNA repair protein RecN [Chloroflexia bacterium]